MYMERLLNCVFVCLCMCVPAAAGDEGDQCKPRSNSPSVSISISVQSHARCQNEIGLPFIFSQCSQSTVIKANLSLIYQCFPFSMHGMV